VHGRRQNGERGKRCLREERAAEMAGGGKKGERGKENTAVRWRTMEKTKILSLSINERVCC